MYQERQRRDNQQKKSKEMESKIDLAMGDAKTTAWEMCELLAVKESKGGLGTLATRRNLYSATAADDFEHMWKSWDELHCNGEQGAGWQ